MFGYRVPAADQAMLISGGRRARSGVPFRVVVGHGAFVNPFLRRVGMLSLSMREAEVQETCVTGQGISVNVRAIIAFKVGNDDESIVNAGQRFLSDQDQMSVLTGRIFSGHLRSIVGSMTVEEIVTERQKLATEVLDGSKGEMAKIGLSVDSLQIQSIDDMGTGYIDAMAAPHVSAIQRQAKVAQAQADKGAAAGPAGANVSGLNGAASRGEMAAGMVAQGMTIVGSVKGNLGTGADEASALRPGAEFAPAGESAADVGRSSQAGESRRRG